MNVKKVERLGEIHVNNQGCPYEIINYENKRRCHIRFKNGYETITGYSEILKGNIKNPYYPSVHGVGYIGVGKYLKSINGKLTKVYKKWGNMLERCYSKKYHAKRPTYVNCTVDERWHNFQVFAEWYEENYKPEYMEGWELDKDILVKGNKIYSPETCRLIPKEINSLLLSSITKRGNYPIGVSKKGKKFKACISIKGISKPLGTFDTIEEAFQAYKNAKEEYIKEIAELWRGKISERVYQAMINYKVEITD